VSGGREADRSDTEALARRLAELADSKGAEQIVVLDMRELVSYTDFLAICTARNERQAKAIVDEARLGLKRDAGLLPGGTDGEGSAGWIVLDYLDAVLHVFTREARERYQLEDLWREAPRLETGLSQDDVRGHLYGAAHG
jgi:ribosome-associated protein